MIRPWLSVEVPSPEAGEKIDMAIFDGISDAIRFVHDDATPDSPPLYQAMISMASDQNTMGLIDENQEMPGSLRWSPESFGALLSAAQPLIDHAVDAGFLYRSPELRAVELREFHRPLWEMNYHDDWHLDGSIDGQTDWAGVMVADVIPPVFAAGSLINGRAAIYKDYITNPRTRDAHFVTFDRMIDEAIDNGELSLDPPEEGLLIGYNIRHTHKVSPGAMRVRWSPERLRRFVRIMDFKQPITQYPISKY